MPSAAVSERAAGTVAYAAAGVMVAPTYLKWALCFEEPETRTLWLGKAVPRDWLAAGEAPLQAANLTTRYGRVSFSTTTASAGTTSSAEAAAAGQPFIVRASVTVPEAFGGADTGPAGGLRLRLRAPLEHAGKLSKVTVGGKAWTAFNAAEETIDFALDALTPSVIKSGLADIVATFA